MNMPVKNLGSYENVLNHSCVAANQAGKMA